MDLYNSGFDISSGNNIVYNLKSDEGNFSNRIYQILGDAKTNNDGKNDKMDKEYYSYFFFLIPHKNNTPVQNNDIEGYFTGPQVDSNTHDPLDDSNYYLNVPDNIQYAKLQIDLKCPIEENSSNLLGDYDLYLQSPGNGWPTVLNYYRLSTKRGDDSIVIDYPASGNWYILVKKCSGKGTFTLTYKILPQTTPVNDDWAFIGSTVHFWPPADCNTLVAKVDASNNIVEGPYILPYEYLYEPEQFINDRILFQGDYPDEPIYKLNFNDIQLSNLPSITDKLLNLFEIDANKHEKLLFAQGAYGTDTQPFITNLAYLYMYPLADKISFPLDGNITNITGLPGTSPANRVVNQFIEDYNSNAYLVSFDNVCGKSGLGCPIADRKLLHEY